MSFKKFLGGARQRKLQYADLINAESELGRTLLGPIPEGHQREFFKHKDNSWIWYEGWKDEMGRNIQMTVRYEIRPLGVYKKVADCPYVKIEGAELEHFCDTAKKYLELVKTKLYC